ncbi:hypothetical protein [Fontibacillus sp. BL9]|uniref:hypothetical protein n=1 Tax=Fontibacillus sp. BL9 TaxID=3389971 RepID=UPI0039797653
MNFSRRKISIDYKINRLWEKHSMGIFTKKKIEREPLVSKISIIEDYIENSILNEHDYYLKILDEGIEFTHYVYELAFVNNEEVNKEDDKKESVVFTIYISRLCNLLVSMRRLVLSGFEEPARIISRTIIETIDIILVALFDKDFSNHFYEVLDNNYSEDKFWRENIAYGKIDSKIKELLEECNLDHNFKQSYLKNKKELKSLFSSSVHSSIIASRNSLLLPSLNHNRMYEKAVLGGISAETNKHIISIFLLVESFSYFLLFFIMERPPSFFSKIDEFAEEMDKVFASYLVIRDLCITNKNNFLSQWE